MFYFGDALRLHVFCDAQMISSMFIDVHLDVHFDAQVSQNTASPLKPPRVLV